MFYLPNRRWYSLFSLRNRKHVPCFYLIIECFCLRTIGWWLPRGNLIKFPRGNYHTHINTLLSLLFTTKFSSAGQVKNNIELFSTFLKERREIQMQNLKKKRDKLRLSIFFFFYKPAYPQKKFHRRVLSVHPGIFLWRALWVYSVSPPP